MPRKYLAALKLGPSQMSNVDLSEFCFLVADNDPLIQNLISLILQQLNAQRVDTAANGDEALVQLDTAEPKPDVIICDLYMPSMDGLELLRHVAATTYNGSILLVSGADKRVLETAVGLAKAHNLKVLGTATKPIQPEQLTTLLSNLKPEAARQGQTKSTAVTADELRRAIESDELEIHFQPKVKIFDRHFHGVECLVRWRCPNRGMISPDAFIPLAEESGLIVALTDTVLLKAMKQGLKWKETGLDLKIAINISVAYLNRLDLPEFIVKEVARHGLEPTNIILEVTESGLMKEITKVLEIVMRLRLRGIGLSLDDYGTGYSSLEQLNRIPFVELKVDKAFVHGVGRAGSTHTILESTVELAKRMDLSVVAEGIETQSDWDLVAGLGVDLAQGNFVSPAIPGAEIPAWAAIWQQEG